MFSNLVADLRRYQNGKLHFLKVIRTVLEEKGLWAIIVYRYGVWCYKRRFFLARLIFKLVYHITKNIVMVLTGISISAAARIGPGLYIGHFGGIFIGDVTIGENLSIGPGVILGSLGLGKQGLPTIGNNVYIGSGAKVLGPIRIGDNAHIGANAVVLKDVPANATAAGVPARVVKIAEARKPKVQSLSSS